MFCPNLCLYFEWPTFLAIINLQNVKQMFEVPYQEHYVSTRAQCC